MIPMRRPGVRLPACGPRRFPDLWTIVLAAGGASRLGRNKLLLKAGGESLLRRATRLATHLTGTRCVVVLGADASQLRAGLAGLDVAIVVNRAWRDGLAGSLRAGVEALPASAAAALVVLADQYAVEAHDLERLARTWSRRPRRAAAAVVGGAPAAPAILPRRYFGPIRRLRGDQGARRLLREAGAGVTGVEIPAAAQDLDARGDLNSFRRARRRLDRQASPATGAAPP
jgi:molybdenum cofactor cytidylyltransferase